MRRVHEMHIEAAYFDLIDSGKKLAELRVNDEKRRLIAPGDRIVFKSRDGVSKTLVREVAEKLTAASFKSLLEVIPAAALGGISEERQLEELRRFYSDEDETTWGVVAFLFGETQNV